MSRPTTRDALLDAAATEYAVLMESLGNFPAAQRDDPDWSAPTEDQSRNPRDVVTHLHFAGTRDRRVVTRMVIDRRNLAPKPVVRAPSVERVDRTVWFADGDVRSPRFIAIAAPSALLTR